MPDWQSWQKTVTSELVLHLQSRWEAACAQFSRVVDEIAVWIHWVLVSEKKKLKVGVWLFNEENYVGPLIRESLKDARF